MKKILSFFWLLFAVQACINPNIDPDTSTDASDFENIPIADEFDYSTSQTIEVNIQDNSSGVRYDLYTLESDTNNLQLVSGSPVQGLFRTFITLPNSSTQLYMTRNENGQFSSVVLDIQQGRVDFNYEQAQGRGGRLKNGCTEYLYAVNGNGGFFTIDVESGEYASEQLPNLAGGGSIACAVDRANRKCYYNTGTTLRYYDIDAG
ncbi:MAG: hypothetical protein AAFU64_15990, partial [Bacteroidota bacterium]